MDNFAKYKECYRLLRDKFDMEQDDAYSITDAMWRSFMPGVPIPNADTINHDSFPANDVVCPRCGRQVRMSEIPEYDYYCVDCEEDFYEFECNTTV